MRCPDRDRILSGRVFLIRTSRQPGHCRPPFCTNRAPLHNHYGLHERTSGPSEAEPREHSVLLLSDTTASLPRYSLKVRYRLPKLHPGAIAPGHRPAERPFGSRRQLRVDLAVLPVHVRRCRPYRVVLSARPVRLLSLPTASPACSRRGCRARTGKSGQVHTPPERTPARLRERASE